MRRHFIFGAVLFMVVTACGGGSESTASTIAAGSTAPLATDAGTSSTAAVPDGPSYAEGLTWEDVWPPDGATAVYRVAPFPGATVDVDARIEYGVDFRGETLDRLVFGTGVPGERGMAVYFDRSTPWVMNVVATEVYASNVDDGPSYTERFEGGMPFDARAEVGDSVGFEGVLVSENPDGSADDLPIGYRVTTIAADDTIEVPFGTVTGLLHIGVEVGFPEVGDFGYAAELWLHAELFLVRFIGSPAWSEIDLVTPFS